MFTPCNPFFTVEKNRFLGGMVRRGWGLVSGAGESKGVGQKESCKNKSTKPDVVQECLEAPLPITVFAEIELINGREGGGDEAKIKNNAKAYMTRFNPKKKTRQRFQPDYFCITSSM